VRHKTGFFSGDVFTVEVQNLSSCWNVYFRAQQDYMINLSLTCSTVIVTAPITKMAMSYKLRMFSHGTNHACLLQNGSFVIITENRDNMDTIILPLENHQSRSSTVYLLHRNTPNGITRPTPILTIMLFPDFSKHLTQCFLGNKWR